VLGLSTALAGAPRGQNLFIAGDGFTRTRDADA
jgi:hypothetical protein